MRGSRLAPCLYRCLGALLVLSGSLVSTVPIFAQNLTGWIEEPYRLTGLNVGSAVALNIDVKLTLGIHPETATVSLAGGAEHNSKQETTVPTNAERRSHLARQHREQ